MGFLGQRLGARLSGLSPVSAGLTLIVAYVALHYLFVSQTAHLLALVRRVPGRRRQARCVRSNPGLSAAVRDELLLGAHAQGSSANLLFADSGYLSQNDLYRLGAITTVCSLVIYMVVGIPWLALWRAEPQRRRR
jgi:DASS family divalent anion:Na+ symporter